MNINLLCKTLYFSFVTRYFLIFITNSTLRKTITELVKLTISKSGDNYIYESLLPNELF